VKHADASDRHLELATDAEEVSAITRGKKGRSHKKPERHKKTEPFPVLLWFLPLSVEKLESLHSRRCDVPQEARKCEQHKPDRRSSSDKRGYRNAIEGVITGLLMRHNEPPDVLLTDKAFFSRLRYHSGLMFLLLGSYCGCCIGCPMTVDRRSSHRTTVN
jgi:hypothetical protein